MSAAAPAAPTAPASPIAAGLRRLVELRPAAPGRADSRVDTATALAELRRLRARLADLGDGDWLHLWRETPSPEDVPFVAAALAHRLRVLGGA
jgi:hypothetical protein